MLNHPPDHETNDGRPDSRTTRLVNREIQLAMVRQLLFHWLFFGVASGAAVVLAQHLLDPARPTAESTYRVRLLVGAMLFTAICVAPWFIYDSIRLSHRIVGPITRLRSAMNQLPKPNVEPLVLRKNDFWHDVVDDFNQLAERVADGRHLDVETGSAYGKCRV